MDTDPSSETAASRSAASPSPAVARPARDGGFWPQVLFGLLIVGLGVANAVWHGGFVLVSYSTVLVCVGLSFLPFAPLGILGGLGLAGLGVHSLLGGATIEGVLFLAIGAFAVAEHARGLARRAA